MSLYRKHTGKKAVTVTEAPGDLDVTASRTGSRVFLHVVNTNQTQSVRVRLKVDKLPIASGRVFTLVADPWFEVMNVAEDLYPQKKDLAKNRQLTFPAASVTAVELKV